MGRDIAFEKTMNSLIEGNSKCPLCQMNLGDEWYLDYVSRYWYSTVCGKRIAIEILYFASIKGDSREFRKKHVYSIDDSDLPGWVRATSWHRRELDEV